MQTRCSHCHHIFETADNNFGVSISCPECEGEFLAFQYVPSKKSVSALSDSDDGAEEVEETATETSSSTPKKKRKSTKQVIAERVATLQKQVNALIPLITSAAETKENESGCRMILDQIIMKALGYPFEEIKTEQAIQGKKADYVLTTNGDNVLVIEAKRVGTVLRDRQILQATSYAAYSGIRWALLTNLEIWQLYRVVTGDKLEAKLLFTIDMRGNLDLADAEYLYLISRDGIVRKGLLDTLWTKTNLLSNENLTNAMLTDDVVNKIRRHVTKDSSVKLTNDEVRSAMEDFLQLD